MIASLSPTATNGRAEDEEGEIIYGFFSACATRESSIRYRATERPELISIAMISGQNAAGR